MLHSSGRVLQRLHPIISYIKRQYNCRKIPWVFAEVAMVTSLKVILE